MRIESMVEEIDIKGGKLTYGQRIELGRIIGDEKMHSSRRFLDAIACLYPDAKPEYDAEWLTVYEHILEGVKYWMEAERTMLHYDPTPEEVAAGCEQLGAKIGPMMTVMTLAEKFGQDPDTILGWEYGKVFGLLYANLERSKFDARYQKICAKKSRRTR